MLIDMIEATARQLDAEHKAVTPAELHQALLRSYPDADPGQDRLGHELAYHCVNAGATAPAQPHIARRPLFRQVGDGKFMLLTAEQRASFEELLADEDAPEFDPADGYRRRGFEVEPGSGEWGIDLFATRGGERIAVRVPTDGEPVTPRMIMELEGARRYFDCPAAAVATNGRVLPDAEQVAAKLGIVIEPVHAEPQGEDQFDDLWGRWILPLAGTSLRTDDGDAQVNSVDWSGVNLVNTTGNERFVRVEIFREVVRRLGETRIVPQEEVNDYVGRASSAVCQILAAVPFFHYDGRVLRSMPEGSQPPQPLADDQPTPAAAPPLDTTLAPPPQSVRGPLSAMVENARTALAGPGYHVEDPSLLRRDGAGLFAVYATPAAWDTLGLGAPPDDRPLYVGRAEGARDIAQHFRAGSTGSSTLRRSLAALLSRQLGLQARPRNPANPQHFSKYALTHQGELHLTEWMRKNLRVALWARPGRDDIAPLEDVLLQQWQPPLNGSSVTTPWSEKLAEARKAMTNQARDWRP